MNKLMTMILFVVGMMLAQSSFAVAPTIKILPKDVTVNVDQTYTFSVTADNFNHYEIQFTTLFNSSYLEFVSFSDINPIFEDSQGVNQFNLNYNPPGSGFPEGLLASWIEPSFTAINLPAGTVLFKITLKGKAPGVSQVTVPCNTDYVCEAIDGSNNTFSSIPSVPANVTVSGTQVFDGLTFSISNETGPTGSEVCVHVKAEKDFTNIVSFQMAMEFDPAKLAFTTFKNCNGTLIFDCTPGGQNYNVTPDGKIYILWFADGTSQPNGVTLPDGTLLFDMCFTVLAPVNTTVPIIFKDQGFSTNNFQDTNGEITDFTLTNGSITAGAGGSTVEKITLTASQESATTGSISCVKISAVHFDSLALLQFGITWDKNVITFNKIQNCNAALGLAMCGSAPTFQLQASTNEMRFKWTDPNPGSGKGVTIPDNATLFEVCYNVIGIAGQSSDIILGSTPGFPAMAKDVTMENFDMAFKNGKVTIPTAGTVTLSVTDKDVCPGSTVCIPITANNFTNINSMEFALNWDSTKLVLLSIQNCNPALDLNCNLTGSPNFFKLKGNTLVVSWLSGSGGCVTLPNGAILFEACFQVIGTNGMSSPLSVVENPNNQALEIIDCDGNVLDVNTVNQNIAITNLACCNLIVNNVVSNVTCKGGSDGSIVANVSGGIGPYSYKWTPQVPPLDSKIYSNIPAGFYNLTVTDTGNPGCTKVVTQIEVKDGEDFKITATVTQAECNCTGGSILINSMGGTPVLFAWTPFVPSKNPNDNIPCGLYSVVVTSQGGCQKTLTNIEVTAKSSTLSVFADVFNPKCFGGCDGLISAAVSPNDPNATFKWNDQYHQNTQTADSLCAGVYIVTATDSEGCTKTASFELADPAEIILSTSSDSASSPNSKNGKAIVTANGGTGAYTYKWNTIPPQVTSIATGLGKGSYTVTVTDGNGCTKSAIVIVGAKDTTIITPVDTSNVLIINLLAGIYHNYGISCQGECDGTIKAIPPSKAVPPLSYAWSGSASSQKGQTAIQLCAGSYNVVITDANGAKFTSKQAITLTAPPSLNLQVVTGLNPTPTATALVDGGVAPYSYKLNEGPYSSVNIFNIDCNFPVSILALDANGCQAIQTIPGPCTTDCNEARLVITPNGDDINEYFVLGCANNYPCNKLTIFDRFGRIMYVKSGYLNDWNGVDNTGIPLPEGGYFWAFEYYHQIPCPNLLTVKPYVAKGSITIVR